MNGDRGPVPAVKPPCCSATLIPAIGLTLLAITRHPRQFLEMIKGDLHVRALLRLEPAPTPAEIDGCVKSAARLFLGGVSKH